jgi:hypothetical protein
LARLKPLPLRSAKHASPLLEQAEGAAGDEMALDVEGVVNRGMGAEEALH